MKNAINFATNNLSEHSITTLGYLKKVYRPVKVIIINVAVLVALILVWKLFHTYQISKLTLSQKIEPVKNLTEEQLLQLGWVQKNIQKSSFLNFAFEKKDSTVFRIGVFGESYAAGAEVGKQSDFPWFLQFLLNKNFPGKYEVLNFGSGSYGFTQAHLLHNYLKEKYHLDAVVFLLFSFNAVRDQNLVYPLSYPDHFAPPKGPVHARYYLEGDQVKLLKVRGKDRNDAVDIFNSLFPPWDYVRYSYFLTPNLRTLIPFHTNYHTNPMYYYGQFNTSESFAIYRKILAQTAVDNPSMNYLVITDIKDLLNPTDEKNNLKFRPYEFRKLKDNNDFIYQAACCHQSPLGNFELAKRTYQSLQQIRLLQTENKKQNYPTTSIKYGAQPETNKIESCSLNFDLNDVAWIHLKSHQGDLISRLFKSLDLESTTATDAFQFHEVLKNKSVIFYFDDFYKKILAHIVEKFDVPEKTYVIDFKNEPADEAFLFKFVKIAPSIYFLFRNQIANPISPDGRSLPSAIEQNLKTLFVAEQKPLPRLKPLSLSNLYVFKGASEYDRFFESPKKDFELSISFSNPQKDYSCPLFTVAQEKVTF